MKGLLRLLFMLIAMASLPATAGDTQQHYRKDTRDFYQTLLDTTGFTGAALLVDGAGEYFNGTSGYANLETLQPWKPDMPFYAGSIGKTFIAVVTLQLWDDGLLDLDDPLTRWLEPEIADHLTGADRVTLRHLLNHTSGIIDVDNIPEWEEAIAADPSLLWNDAASVAFAYDYPLQFEPGSQYQYSNTGYMLLAMIIQRVTGEHASVAVRQRILDPLNLTHTYYQVYEDDGSALVHGYAIESDSIEDTHPWISHFALGAGPIATTTADLGRFYRAIFKDPRLLSKQARNEMLKKNLVRTGSGPIESYGLGIAKSDWGNIVSYWHNGGLGGYLSMVRYFPDYDLVVADFVNFSIGDIDLLTQPAQVFDNKVLSIVLARLSMRDKHHPHD
jgi:D-alanyl-D-alanine carboxypeptidase